MDSKQSGKRSLWRNWVSYGGGMAIAGGLALTALALLWQLTLARPGPYSGILTFVLFPGIVIAGVATFLLGMLIESRRRRRTGKEEARPYPAVDLNDPKQRARFRLFALVAMVVFVALTFSGYHGFLLTESVPFCGSTCHTQMGPEMAAYEHSPHAKVPCVNCHVGGGAGHYVQSKMNGSKQLFEVLFHTYPRPIPTPIKGLRPARETCEECHWSENNWGSQLYQRPHFRYDEKSTPEQITMLIKVGGGKGAYGAGIHWHMAVENEVTFVALDQHLQDIPWVRIKRGDGSVTEYTRTVKPIDPAKIAKLPHHKMDCMDCHNRPAHDFDTPDIAVDRALAAGVFSATLPYAKAISVESLSKQYDTRDEAHAGMTKAVKDFYAQKYPPIATARAADIDRMVQGLFDIYDRNVFPEMKVSFDTYESNIGHRNSAGCFRCHDGKHVSPDGKVIVSECKACHTTPERGPQTGMGEALNGTAADQDWHPWQAPQKYLDVKEHKNVQCWECHLDGRKPKTECNECHSH
jgi:hypothetical protein